MSLNVTNENAYRCADDFPYIYLEKFFNANDCPLNQEQKRVIYDYWRPYYKLELYRYVGGKNNYKGIGWRLTLLFYIIFCLIMLLFGLPINWLITGKKYLSSQTKLSIFTEAWYNKIFYKK